MSNFEEVTEISGEKVSREQIQRMCNRYVWATSYVEGKDVLEIACGSGQGLGLLQSSATTVKAGDICQSLVDKVNRHYGSRVSATVMNAEKLPFNAQSLDVVIIFEAIYYLPDFPKFVDECKRVLRPGGKILISTANKDLFDFNPSPYTHKYYGVVELKQLFAQKGFDAEFFAGTPIKSVSLRQKVLRPVKKIAISLNLVPKTMGGKKLLKRIVFGKMMTMPAEIDEATMEAILPQPYLSDEPNRSHKVIYCVATLT